MPQQDLFQSPDYYLLDELLTEEHLMIRDTVRTYVKKEISPIIEEYAHRSEFPQQIVRQLGELGCFGPTVPEQYGGGGLDYISYGLMMQELEPELHYEAQIGLTGENGAADIVLARILLSREKHESLCHAQWRSH